MPGTQRVLDKQQFEPQTLGASMVSGTQCCLQEAKTEQEGKVLLVLLLELTA